MTLSMRVTGHAALVLGIGGPLLPSTVSLRWTCSRTTTYARDARSMMPKHERKRTQDLDLVLHFNCGLWYVVTEVEDEHFISMRVKHTVWPPPHCGAHSLQQVKTEPAAEAPAKRHKAAGDARTLRRVGIQLTRAEMKTTQGHSAAGSRPSSSGPPAAMACR